MRKRLPRTQAGDVKKLLKSGSDVKCSMNKLLTDRLEHGDESAAEDRVVAYAYMEHFICI